MFNKISHTSVAVALLLGVASAPAMAQSASMADGLKQYKAFAVDRAAKALAGAKQLQAAIKRGDAKSAQEAWIESRKGWEANETIIGEFFGKYDKLVDPWPDGKTGYHAIEAALFSGKLDNLAGPTDKLVSNLAQFHKQISAKGFRLTAQKLLNGTANLAYEVGEEKSKGGESPYAATSHLDMQENVEGIEASYKLVFEPALRRKDAKMADTIHEMIEKLETLVKVPDIKSLDEAAVHRTGEELAAWFVTAAPKLGLKPPKLEEEEGEKK
jgi:iron uptake system EfeUOB component EfeO/EfeM